MRAWRLALLVMAGVVAAVAGTVLAVALNVATGGTARWFPGVESHPLWWSGGATLAVAGAGLLMWWAQRWYEQGLAELIPAVQQPEAWLVDRPDEVNQVVAALARGGTVGVTTAVQGAGGFGKTTVVKMVRADRRVLRRFGGRVHWVTLGRAAGREVLPGLVNGLIAQLEPDRAVTFTNARQAADHLAAILARGPRRLLVLDDVWSEDQLSAFPVAGRCARLVTTRSPSLAVGAVVPVRVDEMSDAQARALLVTGLPRLPPMVIAGLLEQTGRWPLLLRLVNKVLATQARLHSDATRAAEELLGRLRAGGSLQVDQLTGAAARQLDVTDPAQRQEAVWATIQASTGLLSPAECERLVELCVFAEDETIPVPLITTLWEATGGLDAIAARALCARLADLALITATPGSGSITMHDVIRDFLREEMGAARLARLHQVLVDTVAKTLPAATVGPGRVTAWWELPEQARYLRDHLVEHLIAAGRPGAAEMVATDLRWAAARLSQEGPAALHADLGLAATPRAERLRWLLGQAAHLLAPTDPPYSLTDILCSRVGHDPDWGPQAAALAAGREWPALRNALPLPDLPSPALRRTLASHDMEAGAGGTGRRHVTVSRDGRVTAVAIAPDGTWLATSGPNGTIWIWDAATGQHRATFAGHRGWLAAIAISPDGTWLATGGGDRKVRITRPATGQSFTFSGLMFGWLTPRVTTVVIAPSGTSIATRGSDWRVWRWVHFGELQGIHGRDHGPVHAVALAPDGIWFATRNHDGTVWIWDIIAKESLIVEEPLARLRGHQGCVTAMAIAPDGTWLATGSSDGTAWIWAFPTGRLLATLTGHQGRMTAIAIAPDGTWLATGGDDRTLRIWDTVTGEECAVLTGHHGRVTSVAITPDGTWLATGGSDQTVRIWDTAIARLNPVATRQISAPAVALAPAGSWFAAVGSDKTTRLSATATDERRAPFAGHTGTVTAVAFAADGAWLATGGDDKSARIWDTVTGEQRAVFTGHADAVNAVAFTPDGTCLATASGDETARKWDTATGESAVLTGRVGEVLARDGSWLTTTCVNGTLRIWDAATGRQRAALLVGQPCRLDAVAFAPDGSWLATIDSDGRRHAKQPGLTSKVRIWDAATGRLRAELTGHASAIAVHPGGMWLATTGSDKTVQIWDPVTGAIRALTRVDSSLEDCDWSPAGHLLAAVGDAGIYLFAVDF